MAADLCFSAVRNALVEVSRLYPEDGFLLLKDDPEIWIQSNPADRLSSVRRLQLNLLGHQGEAMAIGDSIGELSELTHLWIGGGFILKFLPNAILRLHKLQQLELNFCELVELPANLGDLESLTSLSLHHCHSLKFLPDSVAKLSKLGSLSIRHCDKLEELPANLGDLESLTSLFLEGFDNLKSLPDSVAKLSKLTYLSFSHCVELEELPANLGDLPSLTHLYLFGCRNLKSLPWSITYLSKLRHLYLPFNFRLYTLPYHWDDSLLISVEDAHIRKTWKELKSEMELLSLPFPLMPVHVAHLLSTPGYLRLEGDPTPWIQGNSVLRSSVRLLDLELQYLENQTNVSESITELPELTHLYISHECLSHLSLIPSFPRITHFYPPFVDLCKTEFHFDCLGELSKLVSLHLQSGEEMELPAHTLLPVSLRHLSLSSSSGERKRLPDSYMSSLANLSNLKTLVLSKFCDLELWPLNLHLTKLILRDSTIKSLPMGLHHLEILHSTQKCKTQRCDGLNVCLNQLVNLETLSYTCYQTQVLPSITSLHNLQELQLKDCFNLKELPPNLDELVNLGTLNVSGTRIESLPNSITKLHNLRRLTLPKGFMRESLPQFFEKEVMISVDDTCDKYYMDEGYYDSCYNKVDRIMLGTMEEVNELVVKEFTTENMVEKQAQHRPLSHPPDAIQISEDDTPGIFLCQFPSRTDSISNDNHHPFSDSQSHEVDILPTVDKDGTMPFSHKSFSKFHGNTRQVHAPIELEGGINAVGENSPLTLSRNRDCVATSVHNIAAESSSILHEASLFGENSREAFQNEQMDNINLEMLQRITPCNSIISVHGGSNYHALKNEQDKSPRSGKVKNKTQKIEITRETINSLKSQNMRLVDAAKQLGVSRSTMKRALTEHGIKWPQVEKGNFRILLIQQAMTLWRSN